MNMYRNRPVSLQKMKREGYVLESYLKRRAGIPTNPNPGIPPGYLGIPPKLHCFSLRRSSESHRTNMQKLCLNLKVIGEFVAPSPKSGPGIGGGSKLLIHAPP
ncbi:hypothetical protein NE237_001394 [Protea cynaroides]|uniref:Uncharacterized protein n=1 Tax=Protea cynaroides TaxID=273540 RepID=A0A9Q0QY23_9MAGN|nr:hypothetical protein NE237_001394 [Protea cynaroides]